MFIWAKFKGDVNFRDANFKGNTYFSMVTFSKKTDFSHCIFKERSSFALCSYHSEIYLNGVTGFSNMLIEWKYNPAKFGEQENPSIVRLVSIHDRNLLILIKKAHFMVDKIFY